MTALHFKNIGLGMALIMTLATGCTSRHQEKESLNKKLKIHFPKVTLTLDPHRMEDAFSMAVVLQLYRGLLRFSPQGELLPDLARGWTESPDKLKYVLKLKEGVKFSNGKPITPKNVQMSFARMFFTGASMGADLDYIEGVHTFRKSTRIEDLGIRVVSDSEIEFHLSHPCGLFLKHLAVVDSAILPIESFRDTLPTSIDAGFSGPYRIKTGPDENGVELEKWRSDPLESPNPPTSIQFTLTTEKPEDLAAASRTDSLDHDPVEPKLEKELRKAGWTSTPSELVAEAFVILNPKKIPQDLRHYLFSKVDVREIIKRVGIAEFQPAFGLIPSGISGELKESEAAHLRTSVPKPHVFKPIEL